MDWSSSLSRLGENPLFLRIAKPWENRLLNRRKLPYVVPTIHNFNHLSSLCLEGCKSPKQFPSNTHFRSPIAVNFSLCINLTEFPQITGNVRPFRGTPMEEIRSSVECPNLENCKRLKSTNISSKSICQRLIKTAINLWIFWLCNVYPRCSLWI